MSKRFTETNKWDDPWFIRLPLPDKLLWLYICDRCDRSGVIDFSPELASVQIGHKVTEDQLTRFGESRVDILPNGKWQIKKFLKFQYGTVDANCPAHKPVIALIEANNLKYPIHYPIKEKEISPNRVFNTLEEEDKKKKSKYPIPKPKVVNNPELSTTTVPITKYGYPLPPRCTIRDKDGAVLDHTGRVMDINQVRKAAES